METQALTEQENHTQVATTTPDQLLALAVNNNLDIDKLERLLAMKERWDKVQAEKAFTEALSAFQEECPDLRKTKRVFFETSKGSTEYHFAPLGDIDRQIKPIMKKHGFSKSWKIQDANGKIKVSCTIKHIGGHSETTEMEADADMSGSKNAIQAKGSAVEYLKRYTLTGALGITTADQDIDGRLPELDVDKLHKQYMQIYNQIIQKDASWSSKMHPDNWAGDITAEIYVKAIGKARQILSQI
jgi:hypothetical protein